VGVVFLVGCTRPSRQQTYDAIKSEIDRGQFDVALSHVNKVLPDRPAQDEWDWRFLFLKVRILVWRKESQEALRLLNQNLPKALESTEIAAQRRILQGSAYLAAQDFVHARQAFDDAEPMAANLPERIRCQLLIGEGHLEINQRSYSEARAHYQEALL